MKKRTLKKKIILWKRQQKKNETCVEMDLFHTSCYSYSVVWYRYPSFRDSGDKTAFITFALIVGLFILVAYTAWKKQNAGFVSGDCCGGICSVF